ncbi:helix-turn-helix domain-containing protein [Sphingomonadaceae bacterium G21617-S1]|nr:helix-turn-helix domain-containing protein [Sphingomonadaceae bacterium G21617-S1]
MIEGPKIVIRQGGRLSRKDAAQFLGYSAATLKAWQRRGYGPVSTKVGSRRFYDLSELRAFADGR